MPLNKKQLIKLTIIGFLSFVVLSFSPTASLTAQAYIDNCSTTTFSDGSSLKNLIFPAGGGYNTNAKVTLPTGATITSATVDLAPKNIIGTPYIWIPNSSDNTLAQIRTKDGTLVKLYTNTTTGFAENSFNNNSRITLIPGGDVWVANRGNTYVTWLEPKNDGTEEYRYGGQVDMGANYIRGITFDKNGNIWAGTLGGSPEPDRIKVICASGSCGTKGAVLATLNNASSYGMIGDKYGLVWVQAGGTVISYKYSDDSITAVSNTSVTGAYGIGMDNDSNIWVGRIGGGGVYKITRTPAGAVTDNELYSSGLSYNSGLAASGDNKVWAAGLYSDQVSVFNTSGTFIANYSTGETPHGVAIDFDNNAWVVNMEGGAPSGKSVLNPSSCTAGSGSVTKYKSDGTYVGTYTTCGNGPYNYSDMTGFRSIPTSMSIGANQFFPPSGSTTYTGWGSTLQAALTACDCTANGVNLCSINSSDPTKCDVPLSLFSVTGGTYEAKNLNIGCTTAVAPVLGGLIPCGRLDNNLATPWDDTAPCNLCFGFLMLQNIINWLTQIAVAIAVFILVIAGLFYVFSSGDPGKIELAKSVISYALMGLALIFIAWLLINIIIAALGYSHPFSGGAWNIIDC
ncbi:hypothetical protein KJ575_05075 [Patescibacteria group bacterium]|nr:hypothetical protein [Patescibacteria group bacterium]